MVTWAFQNQTNSLELTVTCPTSSSEMTHSFYKHGLWSPSLIVTCEHDDRIFNYRLSQARRIAENAFGILLNWFQCLLTTLRQEQETVGSIVLACGCLHNIMWLRYPALHNAALDQEEYYHLYWSLLSLFFCQVLQKGEVSCLHGNHGIFDKFELI